MSEDEDDVMFSIKKKTKRIERSFSDSDEAKSNIEADSSNIIYNKNLNPLDNSDSNVDTPTVKSIRNRIKELSDSEEEVQRKSNFFIKETPNSSNEETDKIPTNENSFKSSRKIKDKIRNKFKVFKDKKTLNKGRQFKKNVEKEAECSDSSDTSIDDPLDQSEKCKSMGTRKTKKKSMSPTKNEEKSTKFKSNKISSVVSSDSDSNDANISYSTIQDNITTIKQNTNKQPRISAKQAMENMQKIRSEANRMLREKEAPLPYHRPKAPSLKDILNKRKQLNDVNCLSFKMNDDQLKIYAKKLEERQKEILELYKSDTEDDEFSLHNETANVDSVRENIDNIMATNIDSVIIDNHKNNSSNEINNTMEKDLNSKTSDKDSQSLLTNVSEILANDISNNDKDREIEVSNLEIASTKERESIVESQDDIKTDAGSENIASEHFTNADSRNINLNFNTEINGSESIDDVMNDKNKVEQEMKDDQLMNIEEEMKDEQLMNIEEEIKDDQSMNIEEEMKDEQETNNLQEMDQMIENAFDDEINEQTIKPIILQIQPVIIGTPGMVIDLDEPDGTTTLSSQKTGVQLLREKFMFFSKIKTSDELERERQNKIKPGTQHQKLRQELEMQMAEQRSQEWAKRLEDEKKRKEDSKTELSDCEEQLDDEDCKKGLEEADDEHITSDESEDEVCDEDEIENDIVLKEKKQKKNPLIDNEAELTDDDIENVSEDESESSTSSESEDDTITDKKKSRILKAFEDSDEEKVEEENTENTEKTVHIAQPQKAGDAKVMSKEEFSRKGTDDMFNSETSQEDAELTLGQLNRSIEQPETQIDDKHHTQADVVLDECTDVIELNRTQHDSEPKLDDIVPLCSGKFSTQSDSTCEPNNQIMDTQSVPDYIKDLININNKPNDIDEDILNMCTGRFTDDNGLIFNNEEQHNALVNDTESSRIDELLGDSDDEADKPKKFFKSTKETNIGGRLLIMSSDDETVEGDSSKVRRKKKKKGRRDMEKRKLQLSDDEDEEVEEAEGNESEISDDENGVQKMIDYDSEENEVEVELNPHSMKKIATKFFENEAELTSEDEWFGSDDEDEKGLDRFEREDGDADDLDMNDVKKQLYRAHMRDMLDQDKHEVRLLQEILLEDGDLTGDQRQRKFRWKNADQGFDPTLTTSIENSEEVEELESEEQWRKQRHERQTFLKQLMVEKDKEKEVPYITRNSIIKANLTCRTMSNVLLEVKTNAQLHKTRKVNEMEIESPHEKKQSKDIPSPVKKPFSIMQNSLGRSLLSRGSGSLQRLAALANPLTAACDGTNKVTVGHHPRSFVFAALTPTAPEDDEVSKAIKRKADSEIGTPKLIKKIRSDTKPRKSLLSLID